MDIVLRALAAYVFIVFLMRIVGRRELSSMQPTDVIMLVILGDLVQNGITQSDDSVTGIYLAAGTIGLLATLTALVTYKSRRLKNIVEGEPVILVENGEPVEKNMRAERLSVDDLMELARGQQIESLDQIKWAVLERSGSISFIQNQ
jgi:uncharacterized membrane protein YcaP (DUF421 family)